MSSKNLPSSRPTCVDELSDGALVRGTSELFRPYGVGRVQKVKNGIVKVEFSPSVFMPPPRGRRTAAERRAA